MHGLLFMELAKTGFFDTPEGEAFWQHDQLINDLEHAIEVCSNRVRRDKDYVQSAMFYQDLFNILLRMPDTHILQFAHGPAYVDGIRVSELIRVMCISVTKRHRYRGQPLFALHRQRSGSISMELSI